MSQDNSQESAQMEIIIIIKVNKTDGSRWIFNFLA